MATWYETDEQPVLYDGLGPDEFTGYPPRSIPRQIALGFVYLAAGLVVGSVAAHWLAPQIGGLFA